MFGGKQPGIDLIEDGLKSKDREKVEAGVSEALASEALSLDRLRRWVPIHGTSMDGVVANAVCKHGSKALPYVLALLDDSSAQVVSGTAHYTWRLLDFPDVRSRLRRLAASHRDEWVRSSAISALAPQPVDEDVVLAVSSLRDGSPAVRASALGLLNSAKTLPELAIPLLTDPSGSVRAAAIGVIGESALANAVDLIWPLVTDPDPETKDLVLYWVGRLRPDLELQAIKIAGGGEPESWHKRKLAQREFRLRKERERGA